MNLNHKFRKLVLVLPQVLFCMLCCLSVANSNLTKINVGIQTYNWGKVKQPLTHINEPNNSDWKNKCSIRVVS